jgi:hypothetical protein
MQGREFLAVARRIVTGSTEADWRSTAGRAYYALMLEGRDVLRSWAFAMPRHDQVHAFVRLKFIYSSNSDIKNIGFVLEELGGMRNYADYQLDRPGKWFTSASHARQAILDADTAIQLLDQIEADPARRAAAIASIKP